MATISAGRGMRLLNQFPFGYTSAVTTALYGSFRRR